MAKKNGEIEKSEKIDETEKPGKDSVNIGSYANYGIVFVFVLIISIASLTVISSRQADLADLQKSISQLQAEFATAFLLINNKTQDNVAINGVMTDENRMEFQQLESTARKVKIAIKYGIRLYRESTSTNVETILSLRYFSSDTLLGLLLVSCGIIGAIMSSFRDGMSNFVKTLVLGSAVGFVSMLAVKGGTTIFIMEKSGNSVPFNAYSTALLGIMAGLFSEKFYLALSKLTDKALDRISNLGENETSKITTTDDSKEETGVKP